MRQAWLAILITLIAASSAWSDYVLISPRTCSTAPGAEPSLSPRLAARQTERTENAWEIRASASGSGESSPWRMAPAILAGTAVLYRYDDEIQVWVQQSRTPSADRAAAFAKQFGEPKTYAVPVALLYLYGSLAGDDRARDTALVTAESIVVGGLITNTIKHAINRHRPGDLEEEEPFEGRTRLSFPSGHTTVAFAAATVVATQYGDNDLVPIIAYGLASLTGWSRINDNAHWASDVLAGSYVGYLAAKGVLDLSDVEADSRMSAPQRMYPVSLRFAFR